MKNLGIGLLTFGSILTSITSNAARKLILTVKNGKSYVISTRNVNTENELIEKKITELLNLNGINFDISSDAFIINQPIEMETLILLENELQCIFEDSAEVKITPSENMSLSVQGNNGDGMTM